MAKSSFYPDALANIFQSAKAWRSVALVMIGMFIAQTFLMLHISAQRTVILIPQGLPVTKDGITLNLGEPYTPDYLTSLAKGDIYSLLSWTPETVQAQYGLFLSRATPTLQSERRADLLAEAASFKEDGITQSFYVSRTYVKNQNEVTLHGVLVRAMGGKEVFRGPAAYTITYANAGGGELQIARVYQPTAQEYRTLESSSKEADKAAAAGK